MEGARWCVGFDLKPFESFALLVGSFELLERPLRSGDGEMNILLAVAVPFGLWCGFMSLLFAVYGYKERMKGFFTAFLACVCLCSVIVMARK